MHSISPRLPLVLAIAAALAMVLVTGWQAYGFWQSENASVGSDRGLSEGSNQQSRQREPDVALSSLLIFGNADKAASAPEEDIDNLPETNLKLLLRGVMSASGDFPGSALVEDNKSQTEAYIVGEELPGNATLRAVRPDRIIIERAGALENLFFPEENNQAGLAMATGGSDSGGSDNEPGFAEQQARSASYPGPKATQSSATRRDEIRQRLEQLRNRLRDN